jgi:hypothetical protein
VVHGGQIEQSHPLGAIDRMRELSLAHNRRYVEQCAGNAGHPNAVALNDVFWQEAS